MNIVTDLRLAIRRLLRQPGFAITSIVVLGLGLGATTTLFAVIDAVLVRPLPYPEPDRIQKLEIEKTGGERLAFSGSEVRAVRAMAESPYTSLSTVVFESRVLTGASEPVQLRLARVDSEFFEVFGTVPALGRAFRDDESHADVVVLEYDVWQRSFGGREALIGETIELDGSPVTVIGIFPEGFAFPEWSDGVVPLADTTDRWAERRTFDLFGRLAAGVTPGRAGSELAVLGASLTADSGAPWDRLFAESLLDVTVADHRQGLLLLAAAVGGLLVIVCLELAMLQAVRAVGRRREMAVRTALGAGRSRIFVELTSESLVLAVAGGGLGMIVAQWGLDLVQRLAWGVPRLAEATLDWRVFSFAAATSFAVGLAAGLLPSRGVQRFDVFAVLGGGRTVAGDGASGSRRGLVMAQVAATVVLLVVAGLMVRTVVELDRVDPGLDVDRLASAGLVLPPHLYPDVASRAAWVDRLIEHLEGEPGVASATVTNYVPLEFEADNLPEVVAEGSPSEWLAAQRLIAGKGYFETFGVPVLVGREFDSRDSVEATRRVVINSAFARQAWPGEPLSAVLGRRIVGRGDGAPSFAEGAEVIGVVADVRQSGLDRPAPPLLYNAFAQAGWNYLNVVARAEAPGGVDAMLPAIRRAVWSLDAQRPLFNESSLAWRRDASMRQPLLRASLIGGFSACALLLSAIGLYGVFAFTVSHRRREIGVRLALGARRRQVQRMIVLDGLRVAAIGAGIGIVGALAAGGLLDGLLYGVEAVDPLTLATVTAVLLATAWLAVSLPAGRAGRMQPVDVLREQ